MGQYYTVLLKKGNRRETFEAKCHLKLMEHSYISNAFTDCIFNELYEYGPHRVAWIGDYANKENDAFGGLTHESYIKEYDYVYDREAKEIDLYKEIKLNLPIEKLKKMAIINHTKKLVLDLGDYIENAKKQSEWIINPLAILTACGNGRGGGDYYGTNMDLVGTWAFDSIEIDEIEDVPENYEKTDISFRESYS